MNSESIPGAGNSTYRNKYKYQDKDLTNGITRWYKLDDMNYWGNRTMHGPVRVISEPALLIGE